MNKKNSDFLNEKLIPAFGKFASSRHMVALRDGMAMAVPMIIIGSVFMILAQFPYQPYLDFMNHTFGSNFATVLQYITNASFHLMGLIAVIGISYNLSKSYKVDAISTSLVSMGAYILTIPMIVAKDGSLSIPLTQLDSAGLFTAIIVGLFITDLFVWMVHRNWTIKMPASVPPAVSNSFTALFPGTLVLLLVWIIRLGVEATPMQSIPNVMNYFLAQPLGQLSNTLPGILIAELFVTGLWFFGIHGANVVSGVMMPIWLAAMNQNHAAFAAGKELPNIVTQQFVDNFVHMGGSGATIGLVVMMAFFSKSEEYKALGKLAIVPNLFNINEPIIFGFPVVLNYKIVIPFIAAPMMNILTTYFAMSTGLVAKTMGVMVPWTTPPVISGIIATGHISGGVLQLINILLDGLIYFYFFRSADKAKAKAEQELKAA
ncbi:PTS cellobiose transporter subunit IIC [Companilactobacillus sp. DQM5]|uniref:PTS cellobiose transporter subunit IIC n=1 Tax=Companilactobacillus sp. DQM5 TaxID=3463359 RepID=UPI0040583847